MTFLAPPHCVLGTDEPLDEQAERWRQTDPSAMP